MRVSQEIKIAGQPSIKLRNFFKKVIDYQINISVTAKHLKTTRRIATLLVEKLEQDDYIEPSKMFGITGRYWTATDKARTLSLASAAKPILRKTANKRIAELLERIEIINLSSHYLFKVTKVIIFGSYLSGKNKINDVDIAIELTPKYSDPDEFNTKNNIAIENAEKDGKFFSSTLDRLFWTNNEVWKFLKSRSRTLSLHSTDDKVLETAKQKVIFESAQ
jgi:predicted nucleotidyltransferase